ncbi:MAG: hypothetical protein M3123_00100 [Actinomycetota bacterium]|nr:hypothetical protein [Actinomycetota bacterium]
MRFHRRLARGRSEATPARLLTSVATVVLGVAAVVVAVGLAIYLLA